MAGDWLSISEAATRSGLSQDKMREIADAGIVRSLRPPRTGPGHSHRRLHAEDVDELAAAMRLSSPEREAKLDKLRRRNRGDGSAPPGDRPDGA